MRTRSPFILGLALLLTPALPAAGVDGILEINQACAIQTGCFPGDATGFPVTIDGIDCDSGCLVENNTSANNDGFGLRLSATAGYRANVTRVNTQGAVSGGTDLGNNLLN